MNDFYKVLGVKKKASGKEIKDAYRDKAKVHHPDKGGDEEKFKELADAYRELSDPIKRAHYDRYGMPLDKFEHAVGQILGAVISPDMKDFVLDPLDRLMKVAKEISEKIVLVKAKITILKSDVKELKSKKDHDISLVIRGLEKTVMVCEAALEDHEMKSQACEIVKKHFLKAKELTKREKGVRSEGFMSQFTTSTINYS